MSETSRNSHKWFVKHRFLFLLFTIMLLFILHPLVDDFVRINFLLDIFLSFILLSAIFAVSERKAFTIIALMTALPSFIAHWAYHFLKIPFLHVLDITLGAFFLCFGTIIIISHLFNNKRVTSDLIIGAICGYFLIGLMWAFVYSLVETVLPGSFNSGQSGVLDISALIYFSFVTLCTTGYGDITPFTNQARSLSILEAVMGQMYLAVNIAALVAIRISQSAEKNAR